MTRQILYNETMQESVTVSHTSELYQLIDLPLSRSKSTVQLFVFKYISITFLWTALKKCCCILEIVSKLLQAETCISCKYIMIMTSVSDLICISFVWLTFNKGNELLYLEK